MTADELIQKLAEMKAEFPGRPLTLYVRDQQIAVEVQSGATWFPKSQDEPTLGMGVGSRWLKIEVPDAMDA